MNVCVFCSASDVPDVYTKPAERFATLLAENGHNLVWGGSNVGLMRDIATAAQNAGAKLFGVSMESLKHTARANADTILIAKDLGERKALMLEHCDAIVALVGGTGTLDELTDVFEMKRHGVHNKPIIVLNTNGFYRGLELQYQHMQSERFLDRMRPLDEMITFVTEPAEVIEMLGVVPRVASDDAAFVSAEAAL